MAKLVNGQETIIVNRDGLHTNVVKILVSIFLWPVAPFTNMV